MRVGLCSLLVAVGAAVTLSGCGSDATQLASGLNNPMALTVVGNQLFWLEDDSTGNGEDPANSVIRSMPITGGKPTTILTQPHLDGNLASDGTKLYFSHTDTDATFSVIASCALDGSGVSTLSSGAVFTNFSQTTADTNTELFVANGTLYFGARPCSSPNAANCTDAVNAEQVYSLPVAGGTPSIVSNLPFQASPPIVSGVDTLEWADSSGFYYTWSEDDDGVGTFHFGTGAAGMYQSESITAADLASGTNDPRPIGRSVVQVNGTVFFLSPNHKANTIALMSVAGGGGTPTSLATFQNQLGTYLVGDASGLFMTNTIASSSPGIYALTLSGTQSTLFADAKLSVSTSVGNQRCLALDSKNVYWVEGGFNGGQGTIHAKAR